ncbi:MAG: chromate transporter [Lachnospiraceae bacterium]|nr:chromate transporter [Lachnospiraceae bacterium]
MKKKHLCGALFLTFLKIGAFTFGGGYAMIPLIKREVLEKKGWISEAEMLDIVAVAESTPGPLAINMATFVGSCMAGTAGALAATVGVVLPSFFIILLISFCLKQIEAIRAVQYAFMGIRAGVLVLIANAFLSLLRQAEREWFTYFLMAGAFLCVALFRMSAVAVLVVCAGAGLIRALRKRGEGGA